MICEGKIMGIFRNGELTTEQIGMLMAGVPIEDLPEAAGSVRNDQPEGSALQHTGKGDGIHE